MKKKLNKIRKTLIERLGYVRTQCNLSARELSLLLDKSPNYIAKFQNGDFNMPSEVLLRAILVCNYKISDFFDNKFFDLNNEI